MICQSLPPLEFSRPTDGEFRSIRYHIARHLGESREEAEVTADLRLELYRLDTTREAIEAIGRKVPA